MLETWLKSATTSSKSANANHIRAFEEADHQGTEEWIPDMIVAGDLANIEIRQEAIIAKETARMRITGRKGDMRKRCKARGLELGDRVCLKKTWFSFSLSKTYKDVVLRMHHCLTIFEEFTTHYNLN